MRLPRNAYIPPGSTEIRDEQSTAVVYVGIAGRAGTNTVGALGFSGKRNKPDFNYLFRNEAARDKYVADYFAGVRAREAAASQRAASRKAAGRGVEVGDVLQCSWGYDQTNIDYYEVTALVGKTMVEIRPIAQQVQETGFMSGRCIPVPGKYVGEPMRKVAKDGAVRITSYSSAYKIKPMNVAGAKVYGSSYWSSYA